MTAALLDDDTDLLEILAELLQERGCRCLLARSLDELKAFGPEALAADVAVLDINLGAGQPSGIDAYDWLLSQNFAGRLLFLTGHAHAHPLVARAERLNRASGARQTARRRGPARSHHGPERGEHRGSHAAP